MDADIKEMFDRVERQIGLRISDTNGKLDTILGLTQQIAQIQAIQSHHGAEIVRINTRIDTVEGDSKQAVIRAHGRIDHFNTQLREEIRVIHTSVDLAKESAHLESVALDKRLDSLGEETSLHISKVGEELQKWLNRGWGVIAVMALFSGFFQWLASSTLDNIKASTAEQSTISKRQDGRLSELESMVTTLIANSRKYSNP